MAVLLAVMALSGAGKIDRRALVTRHNVTLTAFDGERPLQVGNGEFAFGMDITGLQTFAPFNTMSHWGWHSGPLPNGQKPDDFKGQVLETHGRPVRYPIWDFERPELSQWLTSNPHRINLGRVGLAMTKRDGSLALVTDLRKTKQTLDLWSGIVMSRFELEGVPVTVKTACHPSKDAIAVKVESPLVREGRIAAFVAVPGNNPLQFANFVGDWSRPGNLEPVSLRGKRRDFRRQMDADTYHVALQWQGEASLEPPTTEARPLKILKAEYGAGNGRLDVTEKVASTVVDGKVLVRVGNSLGSDPAPGLPKSLRVTYLTAQHRLTAEAKENEDLFIDTTPERSRLTLQPTSGNALTFTCAFAPKEIQGELPSVEEILAANRKGWPAFWQRGGAIDLSQSPDPRAKELERRIVLSQYLMKVNEAGSWPPQESGLVNNGWYGRFHLEMTWWHAAHWALWNRWPELNRNVAFYSRILASAKQRAKEQGYQGARWPKCIGPDGREWPHPIHASLVWQQPHPIFFAELDYRAHPTRATLEKWRPVVEATADFLASYAQEVNGSYVLGPPLTPVSENTEMMTTQNPAFELGYWRFGLRTAGTWRSRLGLKPKPEWEKVRKGLSPLPVQDGVYVLHEGVRDMWTKFNFEHPALTGVFGMLPGDGVDRATMRRTYDRVGKEWRFNEVWGWDFPMVAMCAARLGDPDKAVDYLLHPAERFQFDARGLATGGPFPYFPSNGGLLYAVAMMAAGWDGAPKRSAPGFPAKWKVRYEGLAIAP